MTSKAAPDADSSPETGPITSPSGTAQAAACDQPAWLAAYPWMTFVLPLAAFMVIGGLEPPRSTIEQLSGLTIPDSWYPPIYAIKICLTVGAMALVWPGYRQFPWRLSPLALLVGALGVVVWIGLCKLELTALASLGLGRFVEHGQRSAFNPLANWPDEPLLAVGFLAVRFCGLAVIVPVIEEFFLRGLLMRFFLAHEWWKVPFGTLTPTAIIVGTLVPILMHPPAEYLAAAAWFSLVTWLMFKTRNIWDCVAAHAVTNLLLGIWVVTTGDWQLW